MATVLDDIGARLAAGEPLSAVDLEALWRAPDLVRLGMLGDEARRRRHGDRVTFVRVARCVFDAVPSSFPSGAGEIRLVGTPPHADAAVAALRLAVARSAGVPVTAFALDAIEALARDGADVRTLVTQLVDAGCAAIAEAPLDRLADPRRAVGAVVEAGGAIARFTVDAPQATPFQVLDAVRDLQHATGAVRCFAPIPRAADPAVPTTGYHDAKAVALARLALASVPSIQVDWALHGPKMAQVALLFGADDVDGIVAEDDETLGRRRGPIEEIRRNITAASFVPVERDGRFGVRES